MMKAVPPKRRFAVIMAGGIGSRFWPWSRADTPKQLLRLAGAETMIETTARRVRGLTPDSNIIVVTSARLRSRIARALPWLEPHSLLAEPEGRNTAACIGWAAKEILSRRSDGVMAVLSADHLVSPAQSFRQSLRAAFSFADATRMLTTFGVKPSAPETGYGYIEAGAGLAGPWGALAVESFHEKPSLAKAKRYLGKGNFYWNSGIFLWRADVVEAAIARHLPALAAGLCEMERSRSRGRIPRSVLDRIYPRLESISIDYGVLERSEEVAVIPAGFSWRDIGSWNAVAELWPEDAAGNRSRDPLAAIDAHGNVVATYGKTVALLGVDNLVVVDSADALLVCTRDRCEEIKKIVAEFEKRGLRELL